MFQVKIKTPAGAVPVISEKTDLCEQLDKKCPIEEGSVVFRKNVSIPENVPKATYLVEFDALNKDEERITCVEAEVTFE